LRKLGKILGLFGQPVIAAPVQGTRDLDKLMQLFITMREEARKSKNFAIADRIRDGLKECGYVLEDRADKTEWRKL
jgi:cysteinyl-tRNA synthetase